MRARQNKEALKNNKNLKENNTEQKPNLNLKYKSGDELINNSIFENKVIEEINRLRTRPSEYAALLEELSHKIEKNKVKINNTNMKLTEGPQLFEEAINYLLDLDPLEPLIVSEGLSESAHELLSVFVIEEDVRMDDLSSKIHSTISGFISETSRSLLITVPSTRCTSWLIFCCVMEKRREKIRRRC